MYFFNGRHTRRGAEPRLQLEDLGQKLLFSFLETLLCGFLGSPTVVAPLSVRTRVSAEHLSEHFGLSPVLVLGGRGAVGCNHHPQSRLSPAYQEAK